MVGSIFLAMTAAELSGAVLPDKAAYMACHFSPYGRGLSNVPDSLPQGSMLILNDRIPISGHDPSLVAEQLEQAVEQLACGCMLLDFQRTGNEETRQVCRQVTKSLPCPVGISEAYAEDLDGAVFLPPLPPCRTLQDHIDTWQGREIWLETAPERWQITVTEAGSQTQPLPYCLPPSDAFTDEKLHCHYHQTVLADRVEFFLYRTTEDIQELLQEGHSLGITTAIGLWQQFRST